MRLSAIAALICAGACAAALPAWADKPDWVDGHHPRSERSERSEQGRGHDRDWRESQRPAPPPPMHADRHRDWNDRPHDGPDGWRAPRASAPPAYFAERQRRHVQSYYSPRLRAGHCPPGLAKKGNGCLPPGQVRPWMLGQPLPRDLQRYPLPYELRRQLGRAPAGYEYVRIASDILLIAIGTGLVVDAIEDLGGY